MVTSSTTQKRVNNYVFLQELPLFDIFQKNVRFETR